MSNADFVATWALSDWDPFLRAIALLVCAAIAVRHVKRGVFSKAKAADSPNAVLSPPQDTASDMLGRFGGFSAVGARVSSEVKLARAGDASAQVRVALVLLNGYRVPFDAPAGMRWLRLAAAQGNHEACFELGRLYARGIGVSKDPGEAVRWYQLAAASPSPSMVLPQFHLGCMHASGDGVAVNKEEAVRWFLTAAERGHPRAMLFLALALLNGDGVPEDPSAAHRWMRLSAEKGDSTACFHLGQLYLQGRVVPRNPVDAVRWFQLAAADESELLSALPQYHLGQLYSAGDGVQKDSTQAVSYYRLSAERGYPPAQCELGLSFRRGEGVARNDVEALAWLTLASNSSRREPHRQHQQALAAALPPGLLQQANARARELARHVYRQRRGAPIPPAWTDSHAAALTKSGAGIHR
jgi:TPR repeat protein